MLFEKLHDMIFGKISFSATEGFSDIFISDCRKNGLLLYNVIRTEDGIKAEVSHSDVGELMKTASKSGTRIIIQKREGIPDLIIRYRHRYGIPIGLFVFVIILAVLTSMIWSVDIEGADKIAYEEIEAVLEESGVRKGIFSSTVNCKDIEFSLYKRFDKLSWVSVTIIGSRAFVEVRERATEEQSKEEIYSNIVAAKDGEVVKAEIFCGEGEIYPGTAVVKGDLLVSGVKTYRDGAVEFVDSEARISARTTNHIFSSTPTEISVYKKSECKDNYFLYFFGLGLPLGIYVKGDDFTENRYFIKNSDVVFPVGLIREQRYTYSSVDLTLTENQALLIAFYDFALSALKLYEKCEILEKNLSLTVNSGVGINGNFLCVEDIALKKSFTVETEE